MTEQATVEPAAPIPAPVAAPSPSPAPVPAKANGAAPTLGEAEPEERAQVVPANWPSNWKEIMAGGDEQGFKKLSRYQSPVNFFKAYRALEQKIGSGELIRSKPEGDENDPAFKTAINEWRGQVGVPDKPEGYLDKVPDGVVVGEADKPLIESFLKDMHSVDAPPTYVHKALSWYYGNQEALAEQRAVADHENRAKSEDILRADLGPEYRPALNGVRSLFDTYGSKELVNELFSARMPDGTPLGDNVGVLRFLISLSREINPSGGVVTPIEGRTVMETIGTEKQALEKEMADNKSDYYSNPAKQARWRELDDLEQRHKKRA